MEHVSIPLIVRERLAALGLAQLPPAALAILADKLTAQVRTLAGRTISARAVARAVLAAAAATNTGSQPAPKEATNPKP